MLIELKFEKQLRGFYGRNLFYADAKGQFLRELPGGRQVIPGKRVLIKFSMACERDSKYALKPIIWQYNMFRCVYNHFRQCK